MSWAVVGFYLAAAVAANGLVAIFGPWVLPLTGVVLIPFDMTARDVLHERWRGPWLWPRMIGLVAAGSALSMVAAPAAVCVASGAAFLVAGVVDAVTYRLLEGRPKLVRMNGSNAAASVADSVVFLTVAFGGVLVPVVAFQVAAKVCGGFVWSLVMVGWKSKGTE